MHNRSSPLPLVLALGTGSAVHVGGLTWLGAATNRPLMAATLVLSVAVLAWWPLVPGMRRAGLLRALLIVAPSACCLLLTPWWLASSAGAVSSLLIVFVWRGALETAGFRLGDLLEAACVAAAGGPMAGLLWSPLLDARRTYEQLEACDVSPYQRIVVTCDGGTSRLLLDGNRQLSSSDERAYHEALVRPVMSHRPQQVLILGGGDGLAAREVLRHAFVERCVLVELDARVIEMTRTTSLSRLTDGAFDDPRLAVVVDDGLEWLARADETFEAIIVDFPDPSSPVLAGLFATETWAAASRRLAPNGRLALQACSPKLPRVMASIAVSVAAAGLRPRAYGRSIESFGANAFILASPDDLSNERFHLHVPAATLADDDALAMLLTPLELTEGALVTRARPPSIRAFLESGERA